MLYRGMLCYDLLCCNLRHSMFGGTFVIANVKSISDRNLIYHNSLKAINNIEFDCNKTARKRPKNRRPIIDADMTRRSTLSIRLYLRDFCLQFLDNCYNPLMRSVKVRRSLSLPRSQLACVMSQLLMFVYHLLSFSQDQSSKTKTSSLKTKAKAKTSTFKTKTKSTKKQFL